jgi:hypothetical protein
MSVLKLILPAADDETSELCQEATEARALASTFRKGGAADDLLAYADALETDIDDASWQAPILARIRVVFRKQHRPH